MTPNPWLDGLLARLPSTGEAGEAAHRYLSDHRVRVSVCKQPTGARWTIFHSLEVNPMYADGKSDSYVLSLLVHETHHLRQGLYKALSVQGELEAWQIQFAYIKALAKKYSPNPQAEIVIAELMTLSPSNREHLKRARELMQKFAGKEYKIYYLPLFPLGSEIWFRLTGK
jgi:predicted SprT family Zn-dependent metalloprotease